MLNIVMFRYFGIKVGEKRKLYRDSAAAAVWRSI